VRALRASVVCILVLAAALNASHAHAAGENLFVIEGHGYGHGVGMGQYGAEGLAAHGAGYRQILQHYYPGTQLERVSDSAHVRVLLLSDIRSVVVGSVTPLTVIDGAGRQATLPPGQYGFDGALHIWRGDRELRPRTPVRIARTNAPLTLNGRPYRGDLVLWSSGGALSVVNEVAVDDYVRGVIAWEMPASWHTEALRAQAVAARSYALASLTPSRTFDVYPDQRSQMYGGFRAERSGADRAVLTTLRQVLVWDGHVASTYFSSSSGGRTADARDVWGGGRRTPYLVSVPDPYDAGSPAHHWGPYLMKGSTLAARLGVPQVHSVTIVRDRSGRVAELVLATTGGIVRVPGSNATRALGLRSTWFTIRRNDERPARAESTARPRTMVPPKGRRRAAPRVEAALTQRRRSPPQGSRLPLLVILAGAAALALAQRREILPLPMRRATASLAVAAVATGAVLQVERPDPVERSVLASPTNQAEVSTHGQAPTTTASGSTATPSLPHLPEPAATARTALLWSSKAQATQSTPEPATTSSSSEAGTFAERPRPDAPKSDEAPPKPPAPLEIANASVRSLSSSTATIDWTTNLPAITQAAYALGATPLVWNEPNEQTETHESIITGLQAETAYNVWLFARDAYGQTTSAQLVVATTPPDALTTVKTESDTIEVNDRPTFPILLWRACTWEIGSKLSSGIDTFMGNGCGPDSELTAALAGRGRAIVNRNDPPSTDPDVIGSYYPDEWDASLPGAIKPGQLRSVAAPTPGLSFLTLTNHFYSRAEPLPQGKGMYPALFALPDVIGFDLYPLQSWCRPAFGDVFDAQAELQAAAPAKPTFQWVEVAAMEQPCNRTASLDPTPATVEAETWLAIAGGADGIGYFPNNWSAEITDTITRINWEIRELTPALVAPDSHATSDTAGVRVSARALNGALYVIAVNTTNTDTNATIQVPGLAGRTAEVLAENRIVNTSGDAISDDFAPLAVHIYVARPTLWSSMPETPVTTEPDAATTDAGTPPSRPPMD
jgi:stage II sporulation protein D